jgi:stress response protein YsnF
MRTIFGLFDDHKSAKQAAEAVEKAGFSEKQISLLTKADEAKLAALRKSAPDSDVDFYLDCVEKDGSTLVFVDSEEGEVSRVAEILARHGLVDVDRRAEAYGKEDVLRGDKDPDKAMKVVQESLEVGKRDVERGKVRVYNRITSKDVEEKVGLRDETIHVQRRAVDHPVEAEAIEELFKERSFEVREVDEEPVVSKVARVLEEVGVVETEHKHEPGVATAIARPSYEAARRETHETTTPRDVGVGARNALGEPQRRETYEAPRHETYEGPQHVTHEAPRRETYEGSRHATYEAPHPDSYESPRREIIQEGPRREAYEAPRREFVREAPRRILETTHNLYEAPSDHYEFTPEQERVVSRLGNSIRWTSPPMISLGLLVVIELLMYAIWLWRRGEYGNLQLTALPLFLLGIAIMFVGIGAWVGRVGTSFHQIVQTRGNDMAHLMSALSHLEKVWGIIAGFVKALILLTFFTILFNLLYVWLQRDAEDRAVRFVATVESRH